MGYDAHPVKLRDMYFGTYEKAGVIKPKQMTRNAPVTAQGANLCRNARLRDAFRAALYRRTV